ncbi:2-dehydro-3-deoxyphosphooctonate aldolase [Sedimentisphaera cyanobacteriorum]|uniref:2-dehydro-3-deoxyphosphooctonate aldolase n=1 Tax=Sedimentisphaera cyanobacteriorum TaxID=1940790 RepID=A0A1Q2HMD5_9BACT|nr:3-deoxy-8-phosphooctulonate synthase [Sedimentisphaera cyanobacteriorum]AQQ08689.1 2-dehydro-3-deoxyphosphooctonate aldolase [Sedimentisphaera cyanobacteriorum]
MSRFSIDGIPIGFQEDLFVFAGPCVIESRDLCFKVAEFLKGVSERLSAGIVFKASFDKANRSSITSFRGPGIDEGLRILQQVKEQFQLPVVTDIHLPSQAAQVGQVADCLQIPAFLCRQTDLLAAAAETGAAVNVKKGQFLSPWEMKNVVGKLKESGCEKIMLCERGTFFGYNRLVNDMTAIGEMQNLGCPVIFDATHSTQQPGGLGTSSAGAREKAPVLAASAVAAGANGLFFEIHPSPEEALCDSACMMRMSDFEKTLKRCRRIFDLIRRDDE